MVRTKGRWKAVLGENQCVMSIIHQDSVLCNVSCACPVVSVVLCRASALRGGIKRIGLTVSLT